MYIKSKRVQVQSQTLVYILTLVVITMILVFGYISIRNYNKKTNQVALIQFQNQLKGDVESLSFDYGSVKIKEYKLPSGFDEICFVDLKHFEEVPSDSQFIINQPIIKDGVDSKAQKNIFLFGPEGVKTFYVEGLQIADVPYYSCIKSNIKSTDFEIEGKGDGSVVKTPPNEDFCKFADNPHSFNADIPDEENYCAEFEESFNQIYTSSCCDEYPPLCC